jgi:hypothetical protein
MATVGCNSCHEKPGGVSATGQIKWQICRKSGALVSRHLIAPEQFGVCAFEVRTVFDHIHRVLLSFSEAPRLDLPRAPRLSAVSLVTSRHVWLPLIEFKTGACGNVAGTD